MASPIRLLLLEKVHPHMSGSVTTYVNPHHIESFHKDRTSNKGNITIQFVSGKEANFDVDINILAAAVEDS